MAYINGFKNSVKTSLLCLEMKLYISECETKKVNEKSKGTLMQI